MFVARDGRIVDGDDLLYILACDWQETGRLKGPVVGTLMTNYGFERALEQRGIGFVRAKVGDRHVHQALLEHEGVLGGEASGHLLCLDRATTGDGIVSALQVLEVLHARRIAWRRRCGAWRRFRKRPSMSATATARGRSRHRRCVRRWPSRRRRCRAGGARSCARPAPNRWCG